MKFIIFFSALVSLSAWAHGRSLIDEVDQGLNDRTDIIAIYKNNILIYEEFRNNYSRDQKHKLWSMSKSITGLLLGRAVQQGRVNISNSICEYVSMTQLSSTQQCDITVENILFWQSGVQWSEKYIGWNGSNSNVLTGLYGEGIEDFASYYFSLPQQASIPNNWNYSTGDSHILAHILQSIYSPMEYESLPWTLLFDPIGVEAATFERDQKGLYLGGSYVYLSHPNLNKLAQWVMAELQNPDLLVPSWLEDTLTPKKDVVFTQEMIQDNEAPAIPAGHWWVNKASNIEKQSMPWPQAPEDTFAAFGVFGQMMFIIPSEDLVIIRLAQDLKGDFDKSHFLNVTLDFIKEHD